MNKQDAFGWLAQAATARTELQSELGATPEEIAANAVAIEEMNRLALEHATMIKRALVDNPAGVLLLDYLTEATIMVPMMQVSGSLVTGEVSLSPSDWAYVRAGQNSVVHMLLDQIKLATQPNQGVQDDG